MYLLIDIETVRDRALPERASDEFPPVPYHRIVCIGYARLDVDRGTVRLGALVGDDEESILRRFTSSALFAQAERSQQRGAPAVTAVTFNGRKFDLPVIVARAMKHGIPWPWWWREKSARIRFSTDSHIDLGDDLTDYGAASQASLDTWSRLIGCDGKNGNGSNVEALAAARDWQKLAAYCCNDVRLTGALLLRWLLVKGRIASEREIALRDALFAATAEIDEKTI